MLCFGICPYAHLKIVWYKAGFKVRVSHECETKIVQLPWSLLTAQVYHWTKPWKTDKLPALDQSTSIRVVRTDPSQLGRLNKCKSMTEWINLRASELKKEKKLNRPCGPTDFTHWKSFLTIDLIKRSFFIIISIYQINAFK